MGFTSVISSLLQKNNIPVQLMIRRPHSLILLLSIAGYFIEQQSIANPANKKGYESYKYEKFSEELQKRAQDGDEFAQYNLGQNYEKGDGVKQNYAEAVKWFRKSAEQGNAWSQSELGVCYYQGK
ncbi:MAG: sel1 repeat family protein, partial [Flavobacteriia bacterium]|nr:sel1 repeat family protein [Flavobacteriia bacterium]